ncbi:MAG: transcription-repair coupling factor [Acutalibacteraceae bacterium]
MEFLRKAIRSVSEYTDVYNSLKSKKTPVCLTGLSRVHKANIIDTLPADTNQRALVVVSDEGEAQRVCEDLEAFGRTSVIFPARDLVFRKIDGVSHEFERKRVGVLAGILSETIDTVIAPIDAVMTYTVPQQTLMSLLTEIKVSDEISTDELAKKLVFGGYTKTDMIESEGQFASRGGIFDIFVPGEQNPVRIEFWGDEVDTISSFDVQTQRSIESLEKVFICPAREVLYENSEVFIEKLKNFADSLNKKFSKAKENIYSDIEVLNSGLMLSNVDKYIKICYEKPETLLDYLSDALIFIYEPSKVAERIRSFSWQNDEDIKVCFEEGTLCRGLDSFHLTANETYGILQNSDTAILETFNATKNNLSPKSIVNFNLLSLSAWGGLIADLFEDINSKRNLGYTTIVLAGTERAAITLADELRKMGLPADYHKEIPNSLGSKNVFVTTGGLPAGIDYTTSKIAVFTHAKSLSAKKKTRKKFYTKQGAALGSLDELKTGELVVHSVYGIGIFSGIKKVETEGIIKDYISIKFQKNDTLYVPVTQLDMVSRYIGGGDATTVKLNKLGSDQWVKTKRKVKTAVKDMAKELIALYSQRMKLKGFAFSEDTDLQHDFEYHFPYDETEDQLRCINEIKNDMERPVPMERLLCGDVGFGKTEVAIRAAFKAVCDGKQVALLVPTTILAWQHYKTILKRMEHFAVNVEMLSRFRNAAATRDIKMRLKRGEIDIIVGTHRIISGDVGFKDLGLLIIDEEQRFGVAQKEKLKQKFPNVDVLTLSATPIPRTLNMAMTGIRDMSIIEEAPSDRHPVQTYVLEHDRGIILDAIRKELSRGGQVYYIYNRVETIEQVAARLKRDLPDAEIDIAHGQMSETELSQKWQGLIENTIDILVCTTIIETGVDVPNANTLIIENADCFGLAQLHQLRGRVGRSSRRAYAYFTYHRGKALSDIATKRLEAIREYTEFGSGFKIAMRDLEIRGAGNILGAKQHGHMDSVGYDMYVKLLTDAIKEEKGETPTEETECLIDLHIVAHIPEKYIPSLSARLQIYRRIAEIKNNDDCEDVIDELIDRFGEPPKAVLGLIDIALLRNRAVSLGITEVNDKHSNIVIYFKKFSLEKIAPLMTKMKNRVLISAGEKPYVTIRTKKNENKLESLKEILECLEQKNTDA